MKGGSQASWTAAVAAGESRVSPPAVPDRGSGPGFPVLPQPARALGELEARVAMLVEQLGTQGCSGKTLGTPGEEAELQQKVDENEHLRLELQMVEAERVRLSLLEEKLVDVLQLLQRLRDLREHLGPRPSWMPCTKLWLAVSSCRKNHRCQPLQVLHSPTPFSFPAEVAGPACGHPGQPGHHQTSL